jgi:class 3 adenylate cyclase
MTDDPRVGGDELSARVGELRRLTIMFCDVVGSTELSGRLDPETYRELMRGYRAACRDVIESRFEGHIVQLKGDGTLSTFGFPVAHENDAERAVRAGLALVRAVRSLTSAAGESLDVRVAVHHGPVYLDLHEDDIYGLAANVGARLHSLAEPGEVVVSDEVRELVEHHFEIDAGEPQPVKGVAEPLQPFLVLGERAVPVRRSWSSTMVEREDEREQLRAAWAQVATRSGDRPTGILVHGDAGIGKSRLVAALTDDARADEARVVALHGSPFHTDAGLHPIRGLVEARCGISDDADASERLEYLISDLAILGLESAETVPFLAPVLGIDPSAGYEQAATEGRKLEEQVAQAVLDYLVACTEGEPAVVVAENLHWFDDATRALVADLLRIGPGRLLVVGTSRNRESGLWEVIELRPLTSDGCRALIDALDRGLTEQARAELAARSGGIPLYLEELVRARAIRRPAGLRDDAPVPGSVPEALYEPLVARLYSTPAALPVAATAAAAGQQVDRWLLAAAMSSPSEELDAALAALVEARVLERVAGGRYRFRHELLREVAYELQPPSWRRKVHDRLCDLLARDDPADWHVLASHYERAERHHEAAAAYRETAEWARRRGALDEARAHLTRAIDLAIGLAGDDARDHLEVELRLRRGFIAMAIEGAASEDASEDFDRCLELAEADPGSDDMFSTLISLWPHYLSHAELDRAREVTTTLRASLGGERDVFVPHNRGAVGILDWFSGDFASAVDALNGISDELPVVGGEDVIAATWFVPNDPDVGMLVHLALARFMAADVAGADGALARARAHAGSLDFPQEPWSAAYADWLGSWMWIEAGRLDLAEAAVADLSASSMRHGFDAWELIADTQTAVLEAVGALRSGSADAAELAGHAEVVGGHVEVWQMLELRIFLPFYLTTAGALLAAADDSDGAWQRYEESLQLAAETGMRFYDAETTRRLAHLAPDRDATVAALGNALDLARSQAARPFELRIALDLHDLLGGEACPLLERAIDAFARADATSELEDARARMLIPR